MSLLTILAKGFSGLGIASTVPLSFAFHNETINFKSWERKAPPEVVKPVQPSNNQMEEMAEIVKQELGLDSHQVEVGCFAVNGKRMTLTRPALYVCADLASSNPAAFWFHYNWSNKPKTAKRVNQVTSMSYNGSRNVAIQFKDGNNGKLSLLIEIPDWLSGWKNQSFVPKTSCNFTKGSNDSYTLTCPPSGQEPFTQKINKHDCHRPTTLSLS